MYINNFDGTSCRNSPDPNHIQNVITMNKSRNVLCNSLNTHTHRETEDREACVLRNDCGLLSACQVYSIGLLGCHGNGNNRLGLVVVGSLVPFQNPNTSPDWNGRFIAWVSDRMAGSLICWLIN